MSENDKNDMIVEFIEVTKVSKERAEFYLQSANWTLQLAIASFFENEDEAEPGNEEPIIVDPTIADDEESSSSSTPKERKKISTSLAAVNEDAISADATPCDSSDDDSSSKPKEIKKTTNTAAAGSSKPRIVTMDKIRSKEDSDDENEQGQAFYAGGSDTSGQQILGPPRRRDFVADIFRSARVSGAMDEDAPSSSENTRGGGGGGGGGGGAFSGTGHRLGQTEHDSVAEPSTASKKKPHIVPIKIKLWHEGFTIDDGELRSYNDPQNREFLNNIKRGELPEELRGARGVQAHVELEDHHNEEYVKPIPKIKPFSGKGHTLGSPAPIALNQVRNIATASSSSSSIGSGAPKPGVNQPVLDEGTIRRNERLAIEEINVNIHEPTTMLQVRLADGSTYSGRFNHTHTVGDIRTFLSLARPTHTNRDYILMRSYPNKELTDDSQTLEEAQLFNAAILQRFKN